MVSCIVGMSMRWLMVSGCLIECLEGWFLWGLFFLVFFFYDLGCLMIDFWYGKKG